MQHGDYAIRSLSSRIGIIAIDPLGAVIGSDLKASVLDIILCVFVVYQISRRVQLDSVSTVSGNG